MLIPQSLIKLLLFRRLLFGQSDQLSVNITDYGPQRKAFSPPDNAPALQGSNSSVPLFSLTAWTLINSLNSLNAPFHNQTQINSARALTGRSGTDFSGRQFSVPLLIAALASLAFTVLDSLIAIGVLLKVAIVIIVVVAILVIVTILIIEITIKLIKLFSYITGVITRLFGIGFYRKFIRHKLFDKLRKELLRLQYKATQVGIKTAYMLPLKLLATFPKDWDSFVRHDWLLGEIDSSEGVLFKIQKDIALLDRYLCQVIDPKDEEHYQLYRDLLKKQKNPKFDNVPGTPPAQFNIPPEFGTHYL